MTKCDKCGSQSIIFQRYSGVHLCQAHFEDDVHRKIRQTVRETGVFRRGARIAVAMSGGVDSSTLICALKEIFGKRPDIALVGILVDEGIAGYRQEALDRARALCDHLGVPYEVRSFKEAYGITTDEVAAQEPSKSPCTFCGALRRALLNRTAREICADALATGHNLDDEAEAVFMAYLHGEVEGLRRLQPGALRQIKPLSRIPRGESALYARTHGLPPIAPCPHPKDAMSRDVKELLGDFEARHPGTKYSLQKSLDRILDLRPDEAIEAAPCERCGEPGVNGICECCHLVEWARRGAKPLSSGGH